jgi:hypothetical protein
MKDIIFWHLTGMVCVLVLLQADNLLAAAVNQTLNLSAQVNSRAKIALNVNTINFVDFIGEFEDTIPANENPVPITANARTGSNSTVSLTFRANGDLKSGNRSIPINRVTWTATGAGYQNGTMSWKNAQTVGTWTGSGSYAGSLSFFFDLRSDYKTGDYTSSGAFTLSVP